MLRASHDILEPGGRIGGFAIHTRTGLSPAEEELAVDYGPSQVTAPLPHDEMLAAAGFSDVETVDLTDRFLETCQAIWQARIDLEADLRREEGDDAYEEEQEKKRKMVQGINEGLLRRSLFIAHKRTSN